jgi:hypothetical protein
MTANENEARTASLRTADTRDVIAALRRAAHDGPARGAVEALAGYGGGTLIQRRDVRDFLIVDGVDDDGRPLAYMQWRQLHTAATTAPGFDEPDSSFGNLASTARAALLLACSLVITVPMPSLGAALSRWGSGNRPVMVAAIAAAAGLPDPYADAERVKRMRNLAGGLDTLLPDVDLELRQRVQALLDQALAVPPAAQ